MNKKSRGIRTFQFVGSITIISLAVVGTVTGSKIIEDIMSLLLIITTLGVLACLGIIVIASFYYTQKAYRYVLYYYYDNHSNEREKYKAYFAGYSADRMAEIEKKYDDKISHTENRLKDCLKICLENYSFLTRKQRQAVSDIIKSREPSRA